MFRLNQLVLRNHRVLGSITLDFVKSIADNINPYISVMIGINGIGKSQVLRAICEIFNYILACRNNKNDIVEPPYDFTISYSINNQDIVLSKKQVKRINKAEFEGLLPKHLIATSNYVLDKFPTSSNSMYKYCGIRNENTPGLVSTKGLVRKTVDWVIASLDEKEGFVQEIKSLLKSLGLEDRILLMYTLRHKKIFLSGGMTRQHLRDIYHHQDVYFPRRRSDIWGSEAFSSIKDDDEKIDLIVDFLNRYAGRQYLVYENLLYPDGNLSRDRAALSLLYKIGILSYPKLRVYKKDNNYDFAESSSGETTLLCQFLSIMSNIRDNSLILIDEPEQSSHPNWQINYIKWLKEIFKEYSSCHFIISTHSHFLLSDLDPDNSSLIVLDYNREENKIEDRGDDITPYCWSSDDILYRVFKVRNTRNYVFESRMMKLYSLLQNEEQNKEEIRNLIKELEEYKLNDDDPLKKLIEMAEKND